MAVTLSISITVNSQSIANNTSNVTVAARASWTNGSYNLLEKSGSLTIDGTKYSFTSPFNTSQTTSGSCTLFSKTLNIKHSSDGTKKLACSASYNTGVSSGTIAASVPSYTLATIARKSTLSASNGTLGTSQKLAVTRLSTSFTHTITYTCGSATGTIVEKSTNTSISWTPPLSLASQNTTGTSVSITLTITTYNGSTNVGSNTKSITCSIPATVVPSCTIKVEDATGKSATYGGYIQGVSKFKVTITPTKAYGSDIKSYKTTANGLSYTAASFTTGVLSSSGKLTIKTTLTDKRGRTGTASTTIDVLPYSAPSVTALSVRRIDANGNTNNQGKRVRVTFSAAITSLSTKNTAKNTAQYTLEYKKTSDSAYTKVVISAYSGVYSVNNAAYDFDADTGSSYDIRLTATDAFTASSRTTVASTASAIMHWLANGLGMAIGKIAELSNVFDIAWQTRFMGGILHPVLEPNTDLNSVLTPNTYVGANLSNTSYTNCPLSSGTFTLEVVGMGDAGQVKQRVTSCKKSDARAFERIYYSSSWGEWICVSDYAGTLLWSGAYYMSASQIVTFAEPVSKQKSGIVLIFSEYVDGVAKNQTFVCHFIPKFLVATHGGSGHSIHMTNGTNAFACSKYVYISDDQITGHANNENTGTGNNGVTFTNNRFVLRYVIGV